MEMTRQEAFEIVIDWGQKVIQSNIEISDLITDEDIINWAHWCLQDMKIAEAEEDIHFLLEKLPDTYLHYDDEHQFGWGICDTLRYKKLRKKYLGEDSELANFEC